MFDFRHRRFGFGQGVGKIPATFKTFNCVKVGGERSMIAKIDIFFSSVVIDTAPETRMRVNA
jgi:hypothetical protein